MKIAVISDIHANFVALASSYDYISKVDPDFVVFLGDYVTDGPSPGKTISLLKKFKSEYNCCFIRGNREDYLISQRHGKADKWKAGSGSGSLFYTYINLSDEDLDFFASLPITLDLEINGAPTLTLCHGSPYSSGGWIKNNTKLLEKISSEVKGDVILCGHTHRFSRQEVCGKEFIFCPSIGSSQDGPGAPNMLILNLTDGRWSCEPVHIDFDLDELNSDFAESGIIDYGKIYTKAVMASYVRNDDTALKLVTEAWRLARENGYSGDINLPEEYWERAAANIGLDI